MISTPSSSSPTDPVRRAAIRDMVLDSIDASSAAAAGARRSRVVRFASLSVAAAVVLGGAGIALAAHQSTAPGGGTAIAPSATTGPGQTEPQPGGSATTPSGDPGTVAPAGSPSPSAVPADPTAGVGDPSSWLITTAGIGPLTLGGKQTLEAAKTTGSYTVTAPGYVCPVNFYTPRSSADPNLSTEAVRNDTIDSIQIGEVGTEPSSSTPRTPSGIGLGSTRAELLATYPDIESLSTSSATPATSTFGETFGIQDGQGRWLSFILDDHGHVGEIDVTYTKGRSGEFC
ncbi:hypothetical protein AS850_11015 [Frondihabitans sp. 762G35]|uniref:hypothetical protein n=1 Tax=Frondihabitans sp. 762G35 TaxID=1446794 RepID=UPI000D21A3E1|nr:hypothetical protein [Frondihabitans sp. 762G35]ARC57601.1 hypothetical protein AS850_11015 [Frondihabitans sp. 762G35]